MERKLSRQLKPLKLLRTYAAAFSADDSTLVSLSRDVVAWDVATRSRMYRVHPVSHPSDCDISPCGDRVAVKSTSGRIITLRTVDGDDPQAVDAGSDGEGGNLLFSPCGEFLIDGSWEGSICVREVRTGAIVFERHVDAEMVTDVRADATRCQWVFLHRRKHPNKRPDYLSLWTWPFDQPRLYEQTAAFTYGIAMSADGSLIATCALVHGTGYRFRVHTVAECTTVAEFWLDEAEYVKEIRWSPRADEIAVAGKRGFTFYRYPGFDRIAHINAEHAADIAYSHRGDLIALSDWTMGALIRRDAIPCASTTSNDE